MARARTRRTVVVILTLFVTGLLSAGIARAVSGGDYQPSEMDCSEFGEANNLHGVEPGCHNFKLNVEDSSGHRYAQAGILQETQGENPHAGDFKVNTNSDGSGPGVSGGFNSNYEPFTPDSCGVFDIATLPFQYIEFLAGGGNEPCSLTPSGQTPDPGLAPPTVSTGTPDGSIAGLAQDARFYLGADDNLDSGEHDGVHRDCTSGPAYEGSCNPVTTQTPSSGSANGPSDGGAITVNWHPGEVAAWLATLAANPTDPTPFLTNPIPVVDAGFGSCADNICAAATTRQTTIYKGNGPDEKRDVYDYSKKQWDPEECSSGNARDEDDCGPGGMDSWRNAEAQNVVVNPGVQVYGDPDPQSSPIGPYPLPAAYAGTCGVTLGGGQADLSGTPVSNSAGQVSVSTGC